MTLLKEIALYLEERETKVAYVVIKFPGTVDEEIISEHPTYEAASKAIGKGKNLDIMKRGKDGRLTTEF